MAQPREVTFLTLDAVMALHARQIARHGGDPGLRDKGLLDSAISQPRAAFGGHFLHETIPDMAAAYCYHPTSNHAFVDGNKRIGAYAAGVFLKMNGWEMTADPDEFEAMVLALASSKLDKAHVTAFFHRHARPAGE